MKYFILILCVFFLSGCSVEYNLIIDEKNIFHEEILVKATNSSENEEISSNEWPIKVFYDDPDLGENPEKIEGVTYYVDETFLDNNYYHRKLTYPYQLDQFSNANSILSCYEHFYVMEDPQENTLTLSTSSEFLCMDTFSNLENVNVAIRLTQPVISHNATRVLDNTYYWEITPNNFDASGIILTYLKDGKTVNNEISSSKMILAISLLVLFLIFIVIVIFYKARGNKK